MEMEVTDTIKEVDEREWEDLTGTDSVERTYKWHKTVEESGIRKMHYVLIRENKKLQAAACSFLSIEKRYNMKIPFVEVASPMGFSSAFYSKTPEQTCMLIKGLEEVQKKEKAMGILICGLKKEEQTLFKKEVKGFTDVPLRENTYIDLNFTDFEDYLSSLDGKARRSVKITLNKAKRLDIKSVFTNEFSHWKEVAHKLQGYTCEEHNDYTWHLPERFYEALEVNLKENAELVFFFKEDIPLAFGLSLNSPSITQYKFAGTDPKYRELQAYFLIYYEGIKKALERRQKRIYFGGTTYAFKEKIGCKREEVSGLLKLKNPLLNLSLKSLASMYEILNRES